MQCSFYQNNLIFQQTPLTILPKPLHLEVQQQRRRMGILRAPLITLHLPQPHTIITIPPTPSLPFQRRLYRRDLPLSPLSSIRTIELGGDSQVSAHPTNPWENKHLIFLTDQPILKIPRVTFEKLLNKGTNSRKIHLFVIKLDKAEENYTEMTLIFESMHISRIVYPF